MNKKYLIIGVVLLVIIIGLATYFKKTGISLPGAQNPSKVGAVPTPGSQTRQEITAPLTIPGKDEKNLPANVAAPVVVAPANPNSDASFRGFQVKVQNNQFMPNTIIVRVGDTTRIDFTAVDGDYDFTQPDYGFNAPLPKGQTKLIEFAGTSVGKYKFYCTRCGGPDKGPVGYIEVSPKK